MSELKRTVVAKTEKELNRLKARFISPDLEHAYRQQYLDQDKRLLYGVISLAILGITSFVYSDYVIYDLNVMFSQLLFSRCVFIVLSLLFIFFLSKVKHEKYSDLVLLLYALSYTILILFINFTRPSDFTLHVVIDLLAVLVIYVVIPIRFTLQIFAAVIFSTCNMAIILFFKNFPSVLDYNTIWIGYFIMHFIGIIVSRQAHINKRIQYSLWMNEKKLKEKLQKAIENIKTLSGLLPICTSCKKIRDDKGDWHQIETYIKNFSGAKFSHGLCPHCAIDLYGDFLTDEDILS